MVIILNLDGHRLISELFAQKIVDMYPSTSRISLSLDDVEKIFTPTPNNLFYMLLQRADWLTRLATWRYDPQSRLDKAEEYTNKAISIDSNDALLYLQKMAINYLKKDTEAAEMNYRIARNTILHLQKSL